jgi:hypothetical protein
MPLTDAEAKARLGIMTASAEDPTLSSDELDALVKLARRADANGNRFYLAWQAGRAYAVGDLVAPSPRNGHYYTVTVAGTSDDAAPAVWPTGSGGTVVDDSVTWQESGADEWVPTFDLNFAAAEGWRWKAGKAAGLFNIAPDGNSFQRSQVYAQCIRQASEYASKSMRSVHLTSPAR